MIPPMIMSFNLFSNLIYNMLSTAGNGPIINDRAMKQSIYSAFAKCLFHCRPADGRPRAE